MTTTTLFDGTTAEAVRTARTVIAEACQSHEQLRSTILRERDGDYRYEIDERNDVAIRFDAAGPDTRIVVDVVEQPLTGLARLRRQRTPAIALVVAEAVEEALLQLAGSATPSRIDLAA